GGFRVGGSHAYADEGSFAIKVTVNDVGGSSATADSSAAVVDAPLTATGAALTATEGSAFTGVVATFSDANPGGAAGDFTAPLDWGDGPTTAGTVSAGGGFRVAGTHTYAGAGSFHVSVVITDAGGSAASAASTTTVADATLTTTGTAFS